MNKYLLLVFSIIFLSLVSSSGLQITIDNVNLDKVHGEDIQIIVEVQNTENIDMYNISFEDNPFIEIDKIDKIPANSNKSTTATITYDESINTSIKLVGYYLSTVGSSSETYHVDLNYPEGPNPCSMTLIEGDSIVFENKEPFSIIMRDTSSSENIHEFTSSEIWQWDFESPRKINYRLLRNGYPFGSTCQLSVLSDEGYVNNPEFDAILNLNLTVSYLNTIVTANFPREEYTISLLGTQEGFIELMNNGNNVAKDITITGDWFTFSANKFDLEPGYSRLVAYTISPLGSITNTNQTNKTYQKIVKIEGNFDTIEKEFDIFVEYNDVSVGETNSSKEDFLEWLKRNYPELLEPKVVIQYVDNRSKEYNITTSDEKMDGLASAVFSIDDSIDVFKKTTIETNDKLNKSLQELNETNKFLIEKIDAVDKEVTKENDISISVVLAIIFIIIIIIGGFILNFLYKRDKYKHLSRWDNNGR